MVIRCVRGRATGRTRLAQSGWKPKTGNLGGCFPADCPKGLNMEDGSQSAAAGGDSDRETSLAKAHV